MKVWWCEKHRASAEFIGWAYCTLAHFNPRYYEPADCRMVEAWLTVPTLGEEEGSTMNKQQLSEALAWYADMTYLDEKDAPMVAAARLVERLLPGECPKHEPPTSDGTDPDHYTQGCSNCHGTGRVWDEGIAEAVREAIRSPLVEVVSIELEPSQFETALDEMARAVLSALVELLTEKSPSELEWLAARGKGGGH